MPPKHIHHTIAAKSFSCPRCGALADQTWYRTFVDRIRGDDVLPQIETAASLAEWRDSVAKSRDSDKAVMMSLTPFMERQAEGTPFLEKSGRGSSPDFELYNVHVSLCYSCDEVSIWLHDKLLFPSVRYEVEPNSDLDPEIRSILEEARQVFADSPRAAAALLRLCVQKLCKQLGEPGKHLDTDIGELVKKGLPPTIQKALDLVRVIGNNAVHPGSINVNDDRVTAAKLFDLVNLIADNQITQPKSVAALFDEKIPATAKDAIARRDRSSSAPQA